ncbi:Transforming acidic coiled-coil-containing protein 3 [Podila clonocystis]|nr:Transforming acidic coiled-coil-containing protein 3 [Podila clonocystis]
MDPESSPELPPLKRGTYDLDAILAAAENAEATSAPSEDPDGTITSPPPSRPSSAPRKPLSSSTATKKRVSTLKSTLGRFSAPKKVDLEPMIESPSDNITFGTPNFLDKPAERSIDKDLSGDQASTSATDNEDWNSTSFTVDATSPSSISSQLSNGRKGRPIRPTPFARVASPALSSSHLEPVVNSPSRTGSPNNLSSGSLGAIDPTYSTPSSSRPTSRPTSRPHSRVSSNGRYHSRQLSSDSLTSFNAMIDKEDLDEPGHSSGGPFVVSDPEHLRILESEIEDPFSPSMSAIDPDTDAYLSKLIQQSSPFGPRKSPSRGQSPFKSRRNQRGDEDSFMDSTDDALSDKELNSRFRTPKTGARTPTSPLARAVTRGRAGLSLDQIVRDQDPDNFSQVPNFTVNIEQATNDFGPPTSVPRPTSNDQIHGSPPKGNIGESDIEQHVQVDIVVQNVNVGDDLSHHASSRKGGEQYMSDFDDGTPFYQSNAEILDEEELKLHESGDFHETHAQSFAEWMSSSAEISRLEIAPPAGGIMPIPSFSAVMTATALSVNGPSMGSPSATSLPSASSTDARVLTSSYTPAISSPEPPNSTLSTSPSASKRLAIIEKRSHLLDDLLSKARERTKHRTETSTTLENDLEKERESTIAPLSSESMESPSAPSVTFAEVDDVKVVEPESEAKEQDPDSSMSLDKKEHGLVRRPSGILLSSRIRDSTNLDAPRYSIREMEDMKKNVRMDLRIEITNEIREEYERTAEQEAAMYQFEIDELKAALEKEQYEKQQLKNVLDEFETSLADIAVSTAKEIQTLKEDNKRLSEGKSDTEDAFMQLKIRYDELRSLNSKHVENEAILRKAVETLKDDFETSESRYESVKAHADTKLSQASKEMEHARNTYETEIAMLRAQVNRQEVHMRTLETTLETKTKENEDLIMFSEELIAKLS